MKTKVIFTDVQKAHIKSKLPHVRVYGFEGHCTEEDIDMFITIFEAIMYETK